MPKTFKPGWRYFYSEILKQEIALQEKTGKVYCEDKTEYTLKELELMDRQGLKITPELHNAKKVFRGTVVKSQKQV